MMTRAEPRADQKLALQMWKEIREQLPEWHKRVSGHVYRECDILYKIKKFARHFLVVRGLYWTNSDWLCNRYHANCSACPLRSCSPVDHSTAWTRLGDTFISLEGRLKACDEIIKAIESETS